MRQSPLVLPSKFLIWRLYALELSRFANIPNRWMSPVANVFLISHAAGPRSPQSRKSASHGTLDRARRLAARWGKAYCTSRLVSVHTPMVQLKLGRTESRLSGFHLISFSISRRHQPKFPQASTRSRRLLNLGFAMSAIACRGLSGSRERKAVEVSFGTSFASREPQERPLRGSLEL